MKKFILLCAVMGLFVGGRLSAQSCQSLTSNIISGSGKILGELGKLTEKAARTLAPYIVTAATGIPQFSTSAAARQAISDFAGDVIQTQMNIFRALGELDGNGGGVIGARHLYIPTQRTTGELLVERTFIIAPSSYHKVTVKIKKLDGKGGANIAVCAKWLDGTEYNKLDRKFFVDGEGNIGNEQTWVLNNMSEKWLTIHLVKTGGALNKFDYQVSIEGEYDAAKLPKPEEENDNANNQENNNNGVTLQKTEGTIPVLQNRIDSGKTKNNRTLTQQTGNTKVIANGNNVKPVQSGQTVKTDTEKPTRNNKPANQQAENNNGNKNETGTKTNTRPNGNQVKPAQSEPTVKTDTEKPKPNKQATQQQGNNNTGTNQGTKPKSNQVKPVQSGQTVKTGTEATKDKKPANQQNKPASSTQGKRQHKPKSSTD